MAERRTSHDLPDLLASGDGESRPCGSSRDSISAGLAHLARAGRWVSER